MGHGAEVALAPFAPVSPGHAPHIGAKPCGCARRARVHAARPYLPKSVFHIAIYEGFGANALSNING
jgi:hypothetical protein